MFETDLPAEIYGRLLEGAYTAGHSFERVCTHLEWLLQEGRWRKVGPGFDDVNAFLGSIKLDSLRVSAEQRKRNGKLIKDLKPEASQRKIAGVLGVDEGTVRKDLAAEKSAPTPEKPIAFNAIKKRSAENSAPPTVDISGADAAKLAENKAEKERRAEETRQRREQSRSAEPLPNGMEMRIGDCRTVLSDVPDSSVALVLTDPPYAEESEPLYRWLAEFAARVLIPGGSLICYTGHWSLNRDMRIFASISGIGGYSRCCTIRASGCPANSSSRAGSRRFGTSRNSVADALSFQMFCDRPSAKRKITNGARARAASPI
jgi:hypothetical protein